MKMEHTEISHS